MKLLSIYLIPVFIWVSIPGLPLPILINVKTPIGTGKSVIPIPLATPKPSATPRPF